MPACWEALLCAFCQRWGGVVPGVSLPALSPSPFRPAVLQIQSDHLITPWFCLLPWRQYTCLRSS